ncbi:hypothetical protein [Solimonas sp. SE-A11]|uniref:hypothetical protein n=1 Tax=Solimonas sp. SE-A11 TaxID=3054954 RepID=UPI00259C9DE5|nr:hypothetical protein [Solimonas sp. SE-A11]MDM4772712.1 hypothetical protein [Solimonas sp. SE-A11]
MTNSSGTNLDSRKAGPAGANSKDGARSQVLKRVLVMALLSVAGIIGMLLVDSALDWVFFALTALPLVVGGWRYLAERS